MEEIQAEILKFTKDRDWDKFHSPENLAKSISIEAGELLECFQWSSKYNKEEACNELADVFNYCFLLAEKLGVDPRKIIKAKIKSNEEKYPIEKAKGISTKYNKL